jgi:hypothetical protein
LSVLIVGNVGLGSLALQDLHVWFETPRQHSGAYQAWGEGVAANCVSLVCPIMRYNNCNERGQAEVSQRVSELVKAWNRAFRPGRRSPRLVVDADRWQAPSKRRRAHVHRGGLRGGVTYRPSLPSEPPACGKHRSEASLRLPRYGQSRKPHIQQCSTSHGPYRVER